MTDTPDLRDPLEETHALCVILDITHSMTEGIYYALEAITRYARHASATQSLDRVGLVLVDDHYSRDTMAYAVWHSPYRNNPALDVNGSTPAVWFADSTENLEELVWWLYRHALTPEGLAIGHGDDAEECYDCGIVAAQNLFADYEHPVNYWLVADSLPHPTCPFGAHQQARWGEVALLRIGNYAYDDLDIPPRMRAIRGEVTVSLREVRNKVPMNVEWESSVPPPPPGHQCSSANGMYWMGRRVCRVCHAALPAP